MGTETDTKAAGDGVAQDGQGTLSVTDNRTGRNYEIEITDGTVRSTDFRQIKVSDDDFGLMTYDPAYMNTASCRSADHLPRRRERRPGIPRLPDRAARRPVDLPGGRLPARPRRAADGRAARGMGRRDHDPHLRARERQGLHAGLPPRRSSDGDAAGLGRRAVDLLPGRQRDQGSVQPPHPDDPADRQDADARRLRLPPQHGPALRLSRQRPGLQRQLPEHDVQDDRAQVRARSAAGPRAGHPLHPPRRPRAELLDERGAQRGLLTGRSVLGDRRRRRPRSMARCTAAPTRPSCACSSASRPRRTSPTSSPA